MSKTLFISDLHLQPSQPEITKLFAYFLQQEAADAEALYILGDLFEVWIGNDDNNEFNQSIKQLLKQISQNIPVYFMVGNRDFLIGKQFAKETGCLLLDEPTRINLYGIPTLLVHGDSLCTQDTRHQKFRRFSRNPFFKNLFLLTPLPIRKFIANKIRNTSKNRTKNLTNEMMDVTQKTVEQIMQQQQITQLIHGHTHRPNIHRFMLDGKNTKRIVLGAWHKQGSVLVCQPNQEAELINYST